MFSFHFIIFVFRYLVTLLSNPLKPTLLRPNRRACLSSKKGHRLGVKRNPGGVGRSGEDEQFNPNITDEVTCRVYSFFFFFFLKSQAFSSLETIKTIYQEYESESGE